MNFFGFSTHQGKRNQRQSVRQPFIYNWIICTVTCSPPVYIPADTGRDPVIHSPIICHCRPSRTLLSHRFQTRIIAGRSQAGASLGRGCRRIQTGLVSSLQNHPQHDETPLTLVILVKRMRVELLGKQHKKNLNIYIFFPCTCRFIMYCY